MTEWTQGQPLTFSVTPVQSSSCPIPFCHNLVTACRARWDIFPLTRDKDLGIFFKSLIDWIPLSTWNSCSWRDKALSRQWTTYKKFPVEDLTKDLI